MELTDFTQSEVWRRRLNLLKDVVPGFRSHQDLGGCFSSFSDNSSLSIVEVLRTSNIKIGDEEDAGRTVEGVDRRGEAAI